MYFFNNGNGICCCRESTRLYILCYVWYIILYTHIQHLMMWSSPQNSLRSTRHRGKIKCGISWWRRWRWWCGGGRSISIDNPFRERILRKFGEKHQVNRRRRTIIERRRQTNVTIFDNTPSARWGSLYTTFDGDTIKRSGGHIALE